MLQAEYYVIKRENNDNYPLFSWDQKSGEFSMGKPVEYKDPVKLRLGEPISPNFEWVDYHSLSGPVVSKRVADVLAPLNIHGIQLVPAEVRNPKDPFSEIKNYYFLHVWNRIHCLDKEKSELELYKDGSIFGIEEFVLDEKILGMFELRKRLIFELAEDISVTLFHQSIKEVIMAINPKGFRFIKATDWYSDIAFD
ncbi:MAG TPA: hypothetical protein ENJ08_07270 [Gammaproteobacteria bacterium]|nr:hypothetical protein [Gammaproteobacteria bacterium]